MIFKARLKIEGLDNDAVLGQNEISTKRKVFFFSGMSFFNKTAQKLVLISHFIDAPCSSAPIVQTPHLTYAPVL